MNKSSVKLSGLLTGLSLLCWMPSVYAERVENYNNEIVLEWARATDERPLGGFWKKECSESYGLAIGPWNDAYFVTFCGEAGCVPPELYRPVTTLNNDPHYDVIDANIMVVVGGEGQRNTYIRCHTESVNAVLIPPSEEK